MSVNKVKRKFIVIPHFAVTMTNIILLISNTVNNNCSRVHEKCIIVMHYNELENSMIVCSSKDEVPKCIV